MYPPFVSPVRELLKSNDVTLKFVDIGSRNGIIELANVAHFVDAYGFEPNPEEYKKLISGKTDAAIYGIKSPKYNSISYSPYAVGEVNGKHPFYITHGPGAAGMHEPDLDRLSEIRWKGKTYPKTMAEDLKVDEVVDVEVKTLATFAHEKKLDYVDYLKIDVEGAEYEVLKGAGDLLNNVGVIKVEVCFIPMRKKQKLFSDVDLLLRKFGFDLLRYEISPAQIGLKERTAPWSFGPTVGFPERFGQAVQADAVYVNRSILDKKRNIAKAAVLLEKNYIDEALFVLRRQAKINEPEEFLSMLQNYGGRWQTRLLEGTFKVARRLLKPSASNWK